MFFERREGGREVEGERRRISKGLGTEEKEGERKEMYFPFE